MDDNSTDGTYEALEDLKRSGMTIDVLRGTGNLFWAGGMRKGIAYAKENTNSDYYLLSTWLSAAKWTTRSISFSSKIFVIASLSVISAFTNV